MLKEYTKVSQEKTGYRRLFTDDHFDLYVWYDQRGGEIIGFQLVELSGAESMRALTWEKDRGSFYAGVMNKGNHNPTPLLVVNGAFHQEKILQRFCAVDTNLPVDIRQLTRRIIENHHD